MRVLEIQVEVSSEGRPGKEEASTLLDSLVYRIKLLADAEGREPKMEFRLRERDATIELEFGDEWTEKAALASLARLEEIGKLRILSYEEVDEG